MDEVLQNLRAMCVRHADVYADVLANYSTKWPDDWDHQMTKYEQELYAIRKAITFIETESKPSLDKIKKNTPTLLGYPVVWIREEKRNPFYPEEKS